MKPNKKRENEKNALNSVENEMNENIEIVSGLPALDEAYKKFEDDYAGYKVDEEAYYLAMDGKSVTKNNTEVALIKVLHPLSRAMRQYAKKNGRTDIFQLVDVEEYELGKMRDTVLLDHANTVWKKATPILTELAPYNVTPEELADVKAKIDAYDQALKALGGAMANKSSEYDALEAALAVVHEDLRDMDDLMERVKDKNPKFYDAYNSARHVKALGVRHNKTAQPPKEQAKPAQ